MVKITIIIFLLPIRLFSQTSYDKYTQNPKIDASTSKNTSQDATIKKLVADTVALSKRITVLETLIKTMQATITNNGAQISAISKGLYDSSLNIRNYINSMSLSPDSSQFTTTNKILRLRQ